MQEAGDYFSLNALFEDDAFAAPPMIFTAGFVEALGGVPLNLLNPIEVVLLF
jgi:hypothetical protein